MKQVNDIKKIPVQYEETVDGIQLNVTEFSYGASGASVSFTSSEAAALGDNDCDRASFIEFKIEDQMGMKLRTTQVVSKANV